MFALVAFNTCIVSTNHICCCGHQTFLLIHSLTHSLTHSLHSLTHFAPPAASCCSHEVSSPPLLRNRQPHASLCTQD
ncbi:hypothetical protein Y032_0013g2190 [Ancylostoma ceylanicum]|uniref:Uncharacterized protein n=1 Tax=Ancylostoma ceylanicum TaxID=53326 RepID=A0A016VBY4_9BILA|nr:hypothetical protein Y032_0013g2190 [Ancylostoma ceylanicum]